MDFDPIKLNLNSFFKEILRNNLCLIENIHSGARAFLAAKLFHDWRAPVVMITTPSKLDDLCEDLSSFLDHAPIEFPSSEIDLSPKLINTDAVGKRDQVLYELITKKNTPAFFVTTLKALLEKTKAPQETKQQHLILNVGNHLDPTTCLDLCKDLGYSLVTLASEKGDVAIRGGIVDIFPLSAQEPFRIEFWGEDIISIRSYNPCTQRSTGKLQQITISPATTPLQITSHSILDYFSSPPIYIFDHLSSIEDSFSDLAGTLSSLPNRFLTIQEAWNKMNQSTLLLLEDKIFPNVSPGQNQLHTIDVFNLNKVLVKRISLPFIYPHPIISDDENPLLAFLKTLKELSQQTLPLQLAVYCTKTKTLKELKTLTNSFADQIIIHEKTGNLSCSFALIQDRFAAISLAEFASTKILRRQKQRNYFSTSVDDPFVPTPGDTVVHLQNGIGKFLGIEKKPNHLNIETDYLVLEYADKAKLYVPSDQAHMISKYVGPSDKEPSLHDLNSSKWKRSKDLSEKSLAIYAKKLIQIEAQRSTAPAFIYPSHGEEVLKFAESFPYDETPDQLKAIENIYSDMMSPKLMDRLICGDAGFGKTEVIMRAAVKAVCDGHKQVIVMVPTTILANQHYETFSKRMAGFPIRIALLSRFLKGASLQKLFQDVANGHIDILIGTHKLINKQLEFKNPGLLIIDEEQRFGVKIKEHLKEKYPTIDCLTVSATPIPRTLYLSLSGARDLSLISMPPLDRLPVSTFLLEHNDETLSAALRHELLRGGQAYVIHNRIESIFQLSNHIQTLIPEAKVAVAHGQMVSAELDAVFHKFKTQQTNILVATSLIENGIDIPNANTILIDHADKFGMADLYQMKGRVGRWNKKAYCYFLVPHLDRLSGPASKRLQALNKHEFGGGMKIALHDLEIRGTGNLLGTDQSGHISAIGFNLYCKLLKRAVAALKNNQSTSLFQDDAKIEFPYNSRIPDTYISIASIRIEFYQKISNSETCEELDSLQEEIRDRFGPLPEEIFWLFALAKIRLFALKNHFSHIKGTKNSLYVQQNHGGSNQIKKTLPYSLSPTPELLIFEVIETIKQAFPLSFN